MKRIFETFALVLALLLLFSACAAEEFSSEGVLSELKENLSYDASETLSGDENESLSGDASMTDSEEDYSKKDEDEEGFYILYTEDEVDFSKAPEAEILNFPWGWSYRPYTYAKVIFKKDDGFYVYMYCEEKDPLAEVTENDGAVYRDSCMEFFCDYRPEVRKKDANYINLEMNSKGVYLAHYGKYPVSQLSNHKIDVKGEVFDTYWTVTAHIPLQLLKDVYGEYEIGEGSKVECNFTKCGSGTKIPHYGTWQILYGESPNFHQPDYFAVVEIKKEFTP